MEHAYRDKTENVLIVVEGLHGASNAAWRLKPSELKEAATALAIASAISLMVFQVGRPGTRLTRCPFDSEKAIVMTPKEVEDLVHKKTRTNVPVRTIEEQHGLATAYLSYSVDDHNQLTIWHTEVPAAAQHLGVGGRLVEQALELAESLGTTLRLVCPFAKDYLVRHPELRNGNAAAHGALVERESLTTGTSF